MESTNNKPKNIKVEEVKGIEPLADCYQFNKYNRYMIVLKKPDSSLILSVHEKANQKDQLRQKAEMIFKLFQAMEIPVVILIGASDDMTIFEVKQ